jgi:O-methyltransferase involved in polyketide biosynthesis
VQPPPSRDYSSISPSARALLLVKAQTTLPYAREAASILFGEDAVESARRETASSPGAQLRVAHFEARARSIDSALGVLGATCVLEIASGLSLRGLAMAEQRGIFYLDSDLPALASVKTDLVARLHPAPLAGTLRVAALDALDAGAFAGAVGEVPDGPMAIVQEGLLMYLDADEKARLAANIRQVLLARGGAWVTADVYVSAPGAQHYRDEGTKAFVEKHRVDANKFASLDAAEAFFAGQGFALGSRISSVSDDPWGVRETWMLSPAPTRARG